MRCFRGQGEVVLHLHSLTREQSDGPDKTAKEVGRWRLPMRPGRHIGIWYVASWSLTPIIKETCHWWLSIMYVIPTGWCVFFCSSMAELGSWYISSWHNLNIDACEAHLYLPSPPIPSSPSSSPLSQPLQSVHYMSLDIHVSCRTSNVGQEVSNSPRLFQLLMLFTTYVSGLSSWFYLCYLDTHLHISFYNCIFMVFCFSCRVSIFYRIFFFIDLQETLYVLGY